MDPEYRTRGPKGESVYFDYAKFLGFDIQIENSHLSSIPQGNAVSGIDILDPVIYPDEVILRKQRKPKKSKISAIPAASNLISRLNQGMRTIATLRKFEKNIDKKVKAATQLVWSNCYDIGLVYAFCGENSKSWSQVCVAVRKVIKSAGLDYLTDSSLIYQVSTKMDPVMMAKKQIIQAGIKFLNAEEIIATKYRVLRKPDIENRPF